MHGWVRVASIYGNASYAVGQGFSLLGAQGKSVEHDIFQPPHIEYVGEPHAGQN